MQLSPDGNTPCLLLGSIFFVTYPLRAQLRTGELDFLAITEPLALAVGLVCWALISPGHKCPWG